VDASSFDDSNALPRPAMSDSTLNVLESASHSLGGQQDGGRRKSRRLSGVKPDLTLEEAKQALDSPRTNRSRRNSGSDSGSLINVLPAKRRLVEVEPIEEEQTDEIAEERLAEEEKTQPQDPLPERQPEQRPEQQQRLPSESSSIPKGRCKSGRFWKSDRDRFRSVIKANKGLKQSHVQRMKVKEEKKRAKELQDSIKEEKKRKLEDLQRRREENKKRREENERKSEVVQKIKNPAKIKRMKKKQLRQLAKRDTTVVQKM